MRRALYAVLAGALGACSAIGHEKVEGWPELRIVEHYVSAEAMLERCRKYVGFGSLPLACAEFDLAARRCHMWFNESFAPRAIVEHERLHCRGYDHLGATNMRDLLARYQAASAVTGKAAAAAARAAE